MPRSRVPHAIIAAVEPGSIAEDVGLQPGDELLAVNGAPLTDYIAYRFAIADEEVTLAVARGEERAEIEIEKEADDDLGLTFTSDVFDGVRRCRNRCVFCFEEQMPAGMRASLRLRDDDFRLSFLHGNFLTLTNLTRADEARILREHLSPLFVSVHATDPAVRARMLGVKTAPDVRAQLRRLGAGGIEVHAQIVLCPGWNDGEVLAATLADLAALHPVVRTTIGAGCWWGAPPPLFFHKC
jgi:putative radical SAM enzyme (TIGR03279 family)